MKKLLGILAATGLVATTGATVISCSDEAKTAFPAIKAPDVKVGETKEFDVEMKNGDSKTELKAVEKKDENSLEEIKVTVDSQNKNKFKVSYKGKEKNDKATLELSYGDLKQEVTVKVLEADAPSTDPVLSADKTEVTIKKDESANVKITVKNPIKDQKLTVEDSNKEYVTTSVTPDTAGQTEYTLSLKGIKKTDSQKEVKISYKDAKDITIKVTVTEEEVLEI
ncbi:lipoprotein [Spiroplasma turonicum]|uniref:Lipoprotein n=1 Tax=Spiroplasma turonicum TaxID=216946 RepID=A0A0K1P654_9MOLU|nr:lipoprotein [Spiroplasma turonicum]AKU79659.1 hypothetical protein STURON_00413 [Spiroplasma turonicum]ALX70679.1 hypothetical protein STURO_v1c04110 [Spiroplasma turonicum]